jgi:hypothetical protein
MEGLSTLQNLRVLDLASNKISALSNLEELTRYLNCSEAILKCTILWLWLDTFTCQRLMEADSLPFPSGHLHDPAYGAKDIWN